MLGCTWRTATCRQAKLPRIMSSGVEYPIYIQRSTRNTKVGCVWHPSSCRQIIFPNQGNLAIHQKQQITKYASTYRLSGQCRAVSSPHLYPPSGIYIREVWWGAISNCMEPNLMLGLYLLIYPKESFFFLMLSMLSCEKLRLGHL